MGHESSCLSSTGLCGSAGALISIFQSLGNPPRTLLISVALGSCGKSFLMSPLPLLVVLPQDPTQAPRHSSCYRGWAGSAASVNHRADRPWFPSRWGCNTCSAFGAMLPSHHTPTRAQPRQANRALLPLHPTPEAAGFPEQGHCGSHWSPLANKTHRCRERAHKTGHPPQRVRALCHPHPTQGWDRTCQQCGSVRSLCWVWEGSRAPTSSQGSRSPWGTPALPLAGLGEGPHSLPLSGPPSPRHLQLSTLAKPLHSHRPGVHRLPGTP